MVKTPGSVRLDVEVVDSTQSTAVLMTFSAMSSDRTLVRQSLELHVFFVPTYTVKWIEVVVAVSWHISSSCATDMFIIVRIQNTLCACQNIDNTETQKELRMMHAQDMKMVLECDCWRAHGN